jgi:phosphoribosylamine--glycine ligase
MAAAGYPGEVRTGDVIEGLDAAERLPGKIFHSGTRLEGDARVVTSGGRVLCAVGTGNSVRAAQRQAYELINTVRFAGAHYRRDIGHRAAVREAAEAH